MKDFDIRIGFDDEYEDMIAEIYYKDLFILLLSQDSGLNKTEVEISSSEEQGFYKIQFPLSDLLKVIEHAKTRLWELRKDS